MLDYVALCTYNWVIKINKMLENGLVCRFHSNVNSTFFQIDKIQMIRHVLLSTNTLQSLLSSWSCVRVLAL